MHAFMTSRNFTNAVATTWVRPARAHKTVAVETHRWIMGLTGPSLRRCGAGGAGRGSYGEMRSSATLSSRMLWVSGQLMATTRTAREIHVTTHCQRSAISYTRARMHTHTGQRAREGNKAKRHGARAATQKQRRRTRTHEQKHECTQQQKRPKLHRQQQHQQ